jgi:microcin C transport system permease protein
MGAKVVDYLWHIAMPVTASMLGAFAVTTMLTKNAFLEEIGKQYVLTARAKGLSERKVLWKHVMRNALIPIVTVLGLQVGSLLGGAVLTEGTPDQIRADERVRDVYLGRRHT